MGKRLNSIIAPSTSALPALAAVVYVARVYSCATRRMKDFLNRGVSGRNATRGDVSPHENNLTLA